jgi:hypothetical protein
VRDAASRLRATSTGSAAAGGLERSAVHAGPHRHHCVAELLRDLPNSSLRAARHGAHRGHQPHC